MDVQEPPQKILSLEDTVKLVDQVTKALSQGCYASIQPSILCLSSNLKQHGPSLELQHTSHLDRLQLVLRSACRDHKLDLKSRVLLLEMIELRTFDWAPSQHVSNYYKIKLQQINAELLAGDHQYSNPLSSRHNFLSAHVPFRQPNITPGFRPGTSHLLMNIPNRPAAPNRPMNIPNRPAPYNIFMNLPNRTANPNLFHPDRSPPSIILQQPPAGRRPSEDDLLVNLQNASNSGDHSMEETGDQPVKQTMKVHTKGGDLALTSLSADLLHTVKQILQEELSDEILPRSGSSSTSSLGSSKPELVYQRPELLELANSPVCRIPPNDWDNILMEIPDIVKSRNRVLKDVPKIIQNDPIK